MDNLDNEDLQNMADRLGGSSSSASNSLDNLARTAAELSGMPVEIDTSKVEKGIAAKAWDWFSDGMDVGKSLGIASGSLLKFYKDVGEGSTNFTNLNTVMKGLSGSMDQLGPVGRAAASALDTLGPVANELLKELDLQRAAFHDLTKVGALTGDGLKSLQDMWGKSELSLKEFSTAVGKNSQTFALLGGTTAEGVDKFSTMMGDMLQGSDDRLRMMGMTSEDIADSTASYIKIQTNLGLAQKKSATQIEAGAKEYAIHLMTLSKFSGKQVEELEKGIEEAQADDRYMAMQSMVDPDTQKKLQNRHDEILARYGEEAAKGWRDAMAGAATPAAIKYRNTFGDAAFDLNKSDEEMLNETQQYAISQKDNVRNAKLFSQGTDEAFFTMKTFQKGVNTSGENLSTAINDTADAAMGLNPETKKTMETEKKAEKMRNMAHKSLSDFLPIMTDITAAATSGLENLESSTIELVKKMASAAGISSPEGLYSGAKEMLGVGDTKGMTGNAASKQAMEFFMSKGWTKEQAAGIVGNLQQESGNFSSEVVSGKKRGDSGKAVGIAQWHADRQENFKKLFGKELAGSTLEEQLEFVNYELTKGTEKGAGAKIKSASSAEEAGALTDKFYERSAGTERNIRMANAKNLAQAAVESQAAVSKEAEKTAEKPKEPSKEPAKTEEPKEPAKTQQTKTEEPKTPPTAKTETPATPTTSAMSQEQINSLYTQMSGQVLGANGVQPQGKSTEQVLADIKEMQDNMDKPYVASSLDEQIANVAKASGYKEQPLSPEEQAKLDAIKSQTTPLVYSQDQLNKENPQSNLMPEQPKEGNDFYGSIQSMLDQTFTVPDLSLGTTGLTEQLSQLTSQMTGLSEQAKPDLTAPKLAEAPANAAPSAPATGPAIPNSGGTGTDPNAAIAEMNSILSDIVAKLDSINSTGQKQVTATTELGKAVQSP